MKNRKEYYEKNPIYNCIKIIKCRGINLMKEVEDLHSENYKTLKKEFENTNKWKDIPYS